MIATKFGLVPDDGYGGYVISGRPHYVRRACGDSLKRLGTDHIDPYYQHRLDARRNWLGSGGTSTPNAEFKRFSCSLPMVFLPRRVMTLRQCLMWPGSLPTARTERRCCQLRACPGPGRSVNACT